MTTRKRSLAEIPSSAARVCAVTRSSVAPSLRSAEVSPTATIGVSSCSSAVRTLRCTVRSVSLQKARRSECPMMTCDTPNSRSIGALISPVNAPSSSQCIVCAPKRTRVPRTWFDAAGIERKGGAITISMCSGSDTAFARNESRKATVSAAVLCIFQLPARMVRGVLLLKRGNSGKHFAFKVFQRRPTAGGNMRHLGGEAQHVRRRGGISAANDANRPAGRGTYNGLADDLGSGSVGGLLLDAHRTVEDDGFGALDRRCVALCRGRPDIEDHLVANGVDCHDACLAFGVHAGRNDRVDWKLQTDVPFLCQRDDLLCRFEVIVAQRAPHVDAGGREQSVGNSAADTKSVDQFGQMF